MAPFVPYHNAAGQSKIVIFGGLITTEFLEPPPGRSFLFRQTYRHNVEGPIPDNLRELINSPRRPKGPPLHFHHFQTEYIRVESGVMGISVDGVRKKVTAEDGEMTVKAGSIHQFWIHPESPEQMTFCASAADSGIDYSIDRVFFENWYGYWNDALLHDGGLNLFQYLAITDGGDMYTPAPWWVPFFRREIGYWTCVFLGRWVGGLLGYKPFFKEYTTDWDFAVAKMKGSWFQRHLAEDAYSVGKPWQELKKMEAPTKPLSGEFEPYTTDLAKAKPSQPLRGVQPVNGVIVDRKHDSVNGNMDFTSINGKLTSATGMESTKDLYQMRERHKQAA